MYHSLNARCTVDVDKGNGMGKFISVFLVTVIWEEIEKRIAVTDEAFNDEFDLEFKKQQLII